MMGHRTIRMHTSHDQLEFKTFEKDKESELVNAIETGRESHATIDSKSPSQSDIMEALKKLGELKELGVITEEEFQEKKNVLLSKL